MNYTVVFVAKEEFKTTMCFATVTFTVERETRDGAIERAEVLLKEEVLHPDCYELAYAEQEVA